MNSLEQFTQNSNVITWTDAQHQSRSIESRDLYNILIEKCGCDVLNKGNIAIFRYRLLCGVISLPAHNVIEAERTPTGFHPQEMMYSRRVERISQVADVETSRDLDNSCWCYQIIELFSRAISELKSLYWVSKLRKQDIVMIFKFILKLSLPCTLLTKLWHIKIFRCATKQIQAAFIH